MLSLFSTYYQPTLALLNFLSSRIPVGERANSSRIVVGSAQTTYTHIPGISYLRCTANKPFLKTLTAVTALQHPTTYHTRSGWLGSVGSGHFLYLRSWLAIFTLLICDVRVDLWYVCVGLSCVDLWLVYVLICDVYPSEFLLLYAPPWANPQHRRKPVASLTPGLSSPIKIKFHTSESFVMV